jgi:hypothetical protein
MGAGTGVGGGGAGRTGVAVGGGGGGMVGVAVGLGIGVGVAVSVGAAVGVALGEAVGVGVGVAVVVGLGVWVGVSVGVGVTAGVGLGSTQANTVPGEYQATSATPTTNKQAAMARNSPSGPMRRRVRARTWTGGMVTCGRSERSDNPGVDGIEPNAAPWLAYGVASGVCKKACPSAGRRRAQRMPARARSFLGSSSSTRLSSTRLSRRVDASQAAQSRAVMLSGSASRATWNQLRASA